MNIAVVGLWHLGTVTAGCLASAEHEVIAFDSDRSLIGNLKRGVLPVNEPGLAALNACAISTNKLTFTENAEDIAKCDLVWVCFDTPVDDDDKADVAFVEEKITTLFPHLKTGSVLLISSQVPVGFTRRIAKKLESARPDHVFHVAYSPENLRLGKAIEVFTKPDRVIVGADGSVAKQVIEQALKPFTNNIVWMGIESAEMTKHAVNSFLAVSVSFINEIAVICEQVGADAKEVELGLKSEQRIGPKAYLSPGAAFAGGTLARDVAFLVETAGGHEREVPLLASVRRSNEEHKRWAQRRLLDNLSALRGQTIAILGLTYKSGTDTLRRSSSVELCEWLTKQGATVQAHDPAINVLPEDMKTDIVLKSSIEGALENANAVVVATEWPEFRSLSAEEVSRLMVKPLVLDANGFLRKQLGDHANIRYLAVGKP